MDDGKIGVRFQHEADTFHLYTAPWLQAAIGLNQPPTRCITDALARSKVVGP